MAQNISRFDMLCAQAHWVESYRTLWVAPIASARALTAQCTRQVDSTNPGRGNQFRSDRTQKLIEMLKRLNY